MWGVNPHNTHAGTRSSHGELPCATKLHQKKKKKTNMARVAGANQSFHNLLMAPYGGHGAMPGTKKMPNLELILKVVMPSDPTFHFRN